jgi:hypothetical protein
MKRNIDKITKVYNTRSKRSKLIDGLPSQTRVPNVWINATDTKNYLSRDSLVDWLKLYHRNPAPRSNRESTFSGTTQVNPMHLLARKGMEFEKGVIEYINKYVAPVVTIDERVTDETCAKTIEEIRKQTPIIYSAPFKNRRMRVKGIIDLLVRADYLKKLVRNPPHIPLDYRIKKRNYYVVVDIKFSTLPICADGEHLLNQGNYPAYKGQLFLYNQALSDIQNYLPNSAYILGRRWAMVKKNGGNNSNINSLSSFDRLGVIDFTTYDSEYKAKTDKAVKWVKDVRRYGHLWTVNPPSRIELYPNMCADSKEWFSIKKTLADNLADITQLWYCGTRERDKAIEKGVTSWKDPNCTAIALGFTGERAQVLDQIININRDTDPEVKIWPKQIKTILYDWRSETTEIFIDFETVGDIFASLEDLPLQPKTDNIFMIGVYYLDKVRNIWDYRPFIAQMASDTEENILKSDFCAFYHQLGRPKIWYWYADKTMWTRHPQSALLTKLENNPPSDTTDLVVKMGNDYYRNYSPPSEEKWCDLYKLFTKEPIALKGAFKYGLKEIASTMKQHGLIDIELGNEIKNVISNGLDASLKAYNIYKEKETNPTLDIMTHPDMIQIIKYNKFDAQVLFEILNYLRKNH